MRNVAKLKLDASRISGVTLAAVDTVIPVPATVGSDVSLYSDDLE